MAIRLYLDTNVFCRPFDDQVITRIRDETEAFEQILEQLREGRASLVISEILIFEIQRIIQPTKRAKGVGYLRLAKDYHSMREETLALARRLVRRFKLQPRDALHVAGALLEESDYFLTCDDGITKRFKETPLSANIKSRRRILKIMNPVEFVVEMLR